MNNKKFDLTKHIHFGYQTYKEYYEAHGVVSIEEYLNKNSISDLIGIKEEIEKEIIENSKKYICMILHKGFQFVFDDIQRIVDIDSRNHIQTKIIPGMETMYITKPCRDLIYAMVYEEKRYITAFNQEVGTWTLDRYIEKIKAEGKKRLDKKLYQIYGLENLILYGIDKKKFRKKLWFTQEDLYNKINENFKKEVIDNEGNRQYLELKDEELIKIITTGLSSEKTIRKCYKIATLTQLKRRMEKEDGEKNKINVDFKVLMKNEKGFSNAMTRYMIELPKKESD